MQTADDQGFVHPALFYRGRRQYVAATVPFVRDGLAAGEPVAVAAPPAQVAWLRDALGAPADRVRFLDMTVAGRNPGRIIPDVLRAFADATPAGRVRIIGEPIWPGRTVAEYPACAQHEALINAAFDGRAVSILCPYDAAGLPERALADARATHPLLLDEHGATVSGGYDPWGIVVRYNEPLPVPPGAATVPFVGEGQLSDARRFAVRHGATLGLSGVRLEDLAMVVAELTTNSVLHGAGSGTLALWAADGQVVCQVHDAGRLTDPLAGRHPAAPAQPGGRGLLLVNRLADLVRSHTGESGTVIRCYLTP